MKLAKEKTIERTRCVLSGSEDLEMLYKFKDFPVNQSMTVEPEENDILLDLEYDICRESGMIQVRYLATEDVLYNQEHSRSIGKTWQDHHRCFARFLESFAPQHVFEIGGGAGYLEKYYNENRQERIRWSILEPNPKPVEGCRAEYEIGFFDESYRIPDSFDTVVFSHLFEHIYKPDAFMKSLATSLKPGKKLIFSVPDMQAMLKNKQTNTLNFEHTFYLAEPYVDYLVSKNGFEILKKEYYREHSIFYSCVRREGTGDGAAMPDLYDYNKKLFNAMISDYESFAKDVMNRIKTNPDRNVYLFGSHLFSQFLIAFGIDEHFIKAILDNDVNKHGKRLQGCGLYCESPDILKDDATPPRSHITCRNLSGGNQAGNFSCKP